MQSAAHRHAAAIRELLRRGLTKAQSLVEALQISQPTVSRALKVLGEEVLHIGAGRSIQYVLRDASRADLTATVHRVTAQGKLEFLGELVPVYPEGFVMLQVDGQRLHSDGLPWWIYDMRPQGYLGRAFSLRHGARLSLPENLNDWSDGHALRALLSHGEDLPGNLLIGATALESFVNAPQPVPIAAAHRLQSYERMAAAAARGEAGSSAGGEQPKFTAYVEVEGAAAAHVLVKFTASLDTPVSQRWRDLLLAEHTALQVLCDGGMDAARSSIWDHGPQRFLEVQRFDRVQAHGRRALLSFAALDAEFVGRGGSWPDIARALLREGVITPEAVESACVLWAFGTLIGNTDMHSGNLSCMSEAGRPYSLAPAYDMTPMVFAPTTGGDIPVRELQLNIGDQVSPRHWHQALAMAQEFVRRLQNTARLSEAFAPCFAQLQQHVTIATERIGRLAL